MTSSLNSGWVLRVGQRTRRRRPRFGMVPAVPIAVLVTILGATVAAPALTAYDPVNNDLVSSLLPPFWMEGGDPAHLLGTDSFGRDVFARLLHGGRVSLSVAVFALMIAVTIGTVVGVTAGYLGGAVDSILMRLVDILLALPSIIVALTLAVAVGPSFQNLILVLGFLIWPDIARLVRGETLLLRRQEFVRYASAIGVPGYVTLIRHVLPNILPTLMVATTLQVGNVILAEATLSFLGAGVPPPQASWGAMVADGQALVVTGWWIALPAGIAILATVLAFNLLSDWLRDYLDPKTATSTR